MSLTSTSDFLQTRREKIISWFRRILEFSLWQGGVQVLQLGCALLVVRLLSKQEYGWYSIAYALQGTMAQLTMLGTPALFALGGQCVGDRNKLGEIIAAVKQWRKLLFLFLGPVVLPIYGWLLLRNEAPLGLTLMLLALISAQIYLEIHRHVIGAPLELHMRFNLLQKIAFTGNATRIILLLLLIPLAAFNILPVMMVSLIAVGVLPLILTVPRAREFYTETAFSLNKEIWQRVKRISLHSLPSMLTFMFASQISLLAISIFGNVESVAELGAITRLGLALAIPTALVGSVLQPKLATIQDPNRLRQTWMFSIACGALVASTFLGFVFIFSAEILAVFGSQYNGLSSELLLYAGVSAISIFNIFIGAIIQSKGWFKQSWLRPILFLISQVLGISLLPISTLMGAIGLMYFASMANLLVDLVLIYLGFRGRSSS